MTQQSKSTGITRILFWTIAGLWAVTFFLGTASYTDIRTDVKKNTQGRLTMSKDIEYIKSGVESLNKKFDAYLRPRLTFDE